MNRAQIAAYLNNLNFGIILILAVVTPLLFISLTTDFYEIPKMIFVVSTTILLVILWSLSWVVAGKVTITRTPLDIPLLLFLIAILVSTFFSESRYISIFGNFPRLHGSAISWVCYILLYFVITSNIKNWVQVKFIYYGSIISAAVVALVSLMSYFGIYLPLLFTQIPNFTPAGSSFSTSTLAALLIPIFFVSLINPNKFLPTIFYLVFSTLFGVTIALIGNPATQLAAVAGLVLTILISKRNHVRSRIHLLLIPVVISVLIFVASFIPLGKNVNPLKMKRENFPREIQLPFLTSWKVSSRTFSDSPFIGTGPSTYLFNFTIYKPNDFNLSKFWNLRFDSAYNEYLQIFGTLGLLGLISFLVFAIVILKFSWFNFTHKQLRESGQDSYLLLSLSISAVSALIIMAFHVSSLVFTLTFILILGMLMVMSKKLTGKVEDITFGIKTAKGSDNLVSGDILPIIFFIPTVILGFVAAWFTGNYASADYYHRQALNQASKDIRETYKSLVSAQNLNPWIDQYRIGLAQTNFAIANAIAVQKGPSESSPGGSLTDKDKQDIQQLLSQSINEAKNAVAISPRSAQNWEILASIYRQISGVAQNALAFSLDAYGRAIQNDPANPVLRVNVGGVYYSVKNYDLAIRFFSDSANLKPDFANGFYNLAVALRDKGDLASAELSAQRVVAILQKNPENADYKTASEFLADLKARIATNSANQTQAEQAKIVPPAAEENGALQNKNLPEIPVDLQEKENVATPAAVKKPSSTP